LKKKKFAMPLIMERQLDAFKEIQLSEGTKLTQEETVPLVWSIDYKIISSTSDSDANKKVCV
jgi:hypothetical protein